MNKIVEDKMKREILVIKNSLLFENTERKTKFYNIWENDFEDIIIKKIWIYAKMNCRRK